MSTVMFEPITDEAEINETIANRRSAKGDMDNFVKKLDQACKDYRKSVDNPSAHFILPLNEKDGTAFFGKNTDSLYQSLLLALKRNELQTEWRLVRVKKDDEHYLRAVKL